MNKQKNPIRDKKGVGTILIVSLLIVLLAIGVTYYFFYVKPLNEQSAQIQTGEQETENTPEIAVTEPNVVSGENLQQGIEDAVGNALNS